MAAGLRLAAAVAALLLLAVWGGTASPCSHGGAEPCGTAYREATPRFLADTRSGQAPVLPWHASVLLLIMSLLPVAAVVIVHCPELPTATQECRRLAALCLKRVTSGWGATDNLLQRVVEARFCERRRKLFLLVVTLFAAYHMVDIFMMAFSADAVCTDARGYVNKRALLVCTRLSIIYTAAIALMAAKRIRSSRWPSIGFATAVIVENLVHMGLEGAGSFVTGYRFRVIVARLLVGLCIGPLESTALNALHGVGVCILYRFTFEDGMVVLLHNLNSGFLVEQGCPHVFEGDAVVGLLSTLETASLLAGDADSATAEMARSLAQEVNQMATSFKTFAMQEVLFLLMISLLLFLFHLSMTLELTKSLQLQDSEKQLSAVSRILDSLCDATVQLGPNFRVVRPAPRLDVLLHVGPTPGGMLGADFRSIIATEEQRASFEAQVQGGRLGHQPLGNSLFLNLRGSHGADIRVQLLASCFRDVAGEVCHLCGINEVTSASPRGSSHTGEAILGGGLPPPRGGREAAADSASLFLSEETSSSVSGSSTGAKEWDLSKGNYAVEFLVEGTHILQVTDPFEGFVGVPLDVPDAESDEAAETSMGPRLLDLLLRPEVFSEWMTDKLEGIGNGQLRMPHDTTLPLELKACEGFVLCGVHFPELPPEGFRRYAVTMQLLALLNRPGRSPSAAGSAERRSSRRRGSPDSLAGHHAQRGTPPTVHYQQLGGGSDDGRTAGQRGGAGAGAAAVMPVSVLGNASGSTPALVCL